MEQLIERILAALSDAGLDSVRANPGVRAPRLRQPAVAVSVKQAASSAAGFYDYLGVIEDEEAGVSELYGRRVDCTLLLEVCAPALSGAQAAEDAAETVLETLTLGQSCARVRSCTVGSCRYDGAADEFRCPVTAELSAYYYALAPDGGAALTDFILKGDWK